eukprot:364340-Chlamydomonas_euryale.AAC.7
MQCAHATRRSGASAAHALACGVNFAALRVAGSRDACGGGGGGDVGPDLLRYRPAVLAARPKRQPAEFLARSRIIVIVEAGRSMQSASTRSPRAATPRALLNRAYATRRALAEPKACARGGAGGGGGGGGGAAAGACAERSQ